MFVRPRSKSAILLRDFLIRHSMCCLTVEADQSLQFDLLHLSTSRGSTSFPSFLPNDSKARNMESNKFQGNRWDSEELVPDMILINVEVFWKVSPHSKPVPIQLSRTPLPSDSKRFRVTQKKLPDFEISTRENFSFVYLREFSRKYSAFCCLGNRQKTSRRLLAVLSNGTRCRSGFYVKTKF